MKYFLRSVIYLILFFSFCVRISAQTIDTAPLDAYWKMVEPLKQGDSLSLDQWNRFLKIEPNQIYIQNQGFDNNYLERLRKTIQFVYMPKYDSLMKARVVAIEKDPSTYWMTYKVYVYKKYEKELKAYQSELLKPSYIQQMYENAFEWLPKRLQGKDTTVNIHFLGIENDAIAGNGLIIATMWQIYNQDKLKWAGLVGHEMHHVLRKPRELKNISENDNGILYVLNSIVNEGTADRIDKVVNIAHDDDLPMGLGYKDFVLFQADSIVTQIDSNLMEMSASEGKVYKSEKEYRNLIKWTSGHNPGYYMADVIVRNGYKNKLIKNIQNPFQFIYLYNKAAKKDATKPHLFSNGSIQFIKSLEKKYWAP